MSYERLEQARQIEKIATSPMEIADLLRVAERDLGTAQSLINIDLDWALTVAYNSALQAVLALMYTHGYRPRGADMHKTALDFAAIALGDPYRADIARLNRVRRKRHQAMDRTVGTISEQEAKETIEFAKRFGSQLRQIVTEKLREQTSSERY